VTALYFAVIRHRLIFEERMLVEEFGDEYRDYMKKTWRLIPFIY
jgi:protein-S-isoprenylcysteine O-methyltransferase Ste14